MSDDGYDALLIYVPILGLGALVVYVLSLIPIWVYVTIGVTIGCLLIVGFIHWVLYACDVYTKIGRWWDQKNDIGRIRFRKGCWTILSAIAIVALSAAFPVEVGAPVASLIALAFGTRWFNRRRKKRRQSGQ